MTSSNNGSDNGNGANLPAATPPEPDGPEKPEPTPFGHGDDMDSLGEGAYSTPRDMYVYSPEPVTLSEVARTFGCSYQVVTNRARTGRWKFERARFQRKVTHEFEAKVARRVAKRQVRDSMRRRDLAKLMQRRGAEYLAERGPDGKGWRNPVEAHSDAIRALATGLDHERAEEQSAAAIVDHFMRRLAEMLDASIRSPDDRARMFAAFHKLSSEISDEPIDAEPADAAGLSLVGDGPGCEPGVAPDTDVAANAGGEGGGDAEQPDAGE